MVLASRGWLVSSSRAARDARGLYARLLLLSGIVVVAWLAGGVGVAHSETSPEPSGLGGDVLGVGEITERAGRAADELRRARISETTSRATSTIEESTVGAVANEVVHDTGRTVDHTARGATGLVTGVARTGQGVVESTDESLRETTLVDGVTEGLTETVGRDGIESATDSDGPLGLPILGSTEAPAAASADKRSDAEADEGERGDRERDDQDSGDRDGRVVRVDGDVAAHVAETSWRVANEAAQSEDRADSEDDSAERIRLIGGGSHHQVGPDTTGASAPSFPTPGAAGFLMARAGHMVLRAQRVALPGDPTLVVRDAADDPSFSPD
ncbi:hypothetical protein ACWFMI_06875 [Nocardiopsis terrae]